MKQKSNHGLGPMCLVAIEQHFHEGERIINDDLAYRILPYHRRAAVWLKLRLWSLEHTVKWFEKRFPGFWGCVMCRKRYIDDKVIAAAHGQVETLVNLGAGFDTRAYRLPTLARIPIWELDLPENIAAKRLRLRKVLKQVPAHVILVPIDFECQELEAVLATHGYTADTKTFFICEAVTQYLTEAGVHKTFDFLTKAPSSSQLVFTYVRKDFIDGKVPYGQEYAYEKWVLKEKSWRFGMNPRNVADFLNIYGWRVLEHLGYEELSERYLKPTGRKLVPSSLARIVYAEKQL